ncbi:hypothetical protein EYF80_041174 [Liparis tanakae]|uniref:Uncharacterized protein n=1 Tax=Liparis tanakae TaxID=230148 RepID=A0A4Z2G4Z1_9TELE|nr:hypothetical protein EYF80_041174 [Liparis tanakae]
MSLANKDDTRSHISHEVRPTTLLGAGNACVHQVEFWLVLFLTSPVSTSDFYPSEEGGKKSVFFWSATGPQWRRPSFPTVFSKPRA